MIVDARQLPGDHVLEADLCIVGAGAAGITLARELIGAPLRVLLVESGDYGYDETTQSLYAGPNLGFPATPLDASRLRFLGGTTNHWTGHCMPLAPVDFEAREGIPYTGWPISRADLDPYYEKAQVLVELPTEHAYDVNHWAREVGAPPLPVDPAKLRNILYYESPPTAFGSVYEDDLAAARNVVVYLNANVLELESDDAASTVTAARAACIDGPRFSIAAKRYVLAMGGIETPRLLLLSNRTAEAGLGNQNDLVGRFFMDHLSLRPALTAFLRPGAADDFGLYAKAHRAPGGYLRGAMASSDELVRRESIGGFWFFASTGGASPGRHSGGELRRALAEGVLPDDLGEHLMNILTDLDGASNALYQKMFSRRGELVEQTWLAPWVSLESLPNPDSRVKLVDSRDHFGQRRVGLDWRVLDADLRTARRATEIFAEELGRLGYGRIWSEILRRGDQWPDYTRLPGYLGHGKHHCGTTRMSADPKTGVVDADCRVHGMSNLYISSSAVFPTHGYATPTLTIVALALRLADLIKADMSRGAL